MDYKERATLKETEDIFGDAFNTTNRTRFMGVFPKDGVQADIFERMNREGWNSDTKQRHWGRFLAVGYSCDYENQPQEQKKL